LVAVIDTPLGVLMTLQEVIATKALDRIGELLRESGTTLEELIESGREERAQIVKERHVQSGAPALPGSQCLVHD
jgi:hypothetical protein